MDNNEAIHILLRVATIYVGMMREDMQDYEEDEYLEILKAMEVLKHG